MTGVLIKRGNLDTETCTQEELHMKIGVILHKPRNYLKQGERPGTDPSLELSEGAWLSQHIDFGLPASRTVRQ